MTIDNFKSQLILPAIASPMFLVSGTELVISACKSGICGAFPSLNGRTSADFEEMLKTITTGLESFERETGNKPAPFGVNLIVNHTNPRVLEDLKLCIKYKVPLVITSLGAVKDLVDQVHNYGGLVFHDVIKKRHAEKAAEAGVDGIIAVATGAGGHGGTASPFALLKEIRSFYEGALVLAGALNTGSDILAAQNAGADFAYMGTRFIATQESMAQKEYKQMLTQTKIDDIIYTDGISGVNANFIKASIEKAGIDITQKKEEDFSKLNNGNSKAWKDIWSAGHGATTISDIPKVTTLVERLKSEYKNALLQGQNRLKNLRF